MYLVCGGANGLQRNGRPCERVCAVALKKTRLWFQKYCLLRETSATGVKVNCWLPPTMLLSLCATNRWDQEYPRNQLSQVITASANDGKRAIWSVTKPNHTTYCGSPGISLLK